LLLLEVYGKAEVKPDAQSKAKLLTLVRSFPKGEVTRKRVIAEMIGYVDIHGHAVHADDCRWSAKAGEFPAGDPELHHVAGSLYAEGRCIINHSHPIALTLGRGRTLRSRTSSHPRHQRLARHPRQARVRMVHRRRSPHMSPLRRPRSPPLSPHRQRPRRQQVPPALHKPSRPKLAEPGRARSEQQDLRPARLSLPPTPQLPRLAPAGRAAQQPGLVSPTQVALPDPSQGCAAVGRGACGNRPDVFWHQDSIANEPAVRHDG